MKPAARLKIITIRMMPAIEPKLHQQFRLLGIAGRQRRAVGMTVQVWWIDTPRELCRIFAPWDGTVVVTSERVINCPSQP